MHFTINSGVLKSHIGTAYASYMLHRPSKEWMLKIPAIINSSRARAKKSSLQLPDKKSEQNWQNEGHGPHSTHEKSRTAQGKIPQYFMFFCVYNHSPVLPKLV